MNKPEHKPRLLEGTSDLINAHLSLIARSPGAKFSDRALALKLSKVAPPGDDLTPLIRQLFATICNNWERGERQNRSGRNWRWEPQIEKPGNKETKWERTLVSRANGHPHTHRWANQIPIGSGMSPKGKKDEDDTVTPRRVLEGCGHLDLAHWDENGNLTLIEFKLNSNNPVYAALQLVRYALVFILARKNNLLKNSTPWKDATRVDLRVLAPTHYECAEMTQFYYRGFKLRWFEQR
jgi:hypothetical protein